jgi:glycerophosphoryl diester phosphodiesterase
MNKWTFFTAFACLFGLFSCEGNKSRHPNEISEEDAAGKFVRDSTFKIGADFDIQGHRGARGLFPENTLFGMLSAARISGITTLEMDVVISKDNQVVLSHEPWMSSEICSFSNGDRLLPPDDEKYRLYDMPYEQIKLFDCGKRWNKNFPKQRPRAQVKPLLTDVFREVENLIINEKLPLIRYNIEIKSRPEWDNFMTPEPDKFARLVYEVISKNGLKERVTIQSFDARSLKAMRRLDEKIPLSYLVEGEKDFRKKLAELDFTPQIYSPRYTLIGKEEVKAIHELGMRVIPWTVNDSVQIMKTIETGVDGIISDDPQSAAKIAKLYR